jgi:hypothetical protein
MNVALFHMFMTFMTFMTFIPDANSQFGNTAIYKKLRKKVSKKRKFEKAFKVHNVHATFAFSSLQAIQ